jgi:hypothetical protein
MVRVAFWLFSQRSRNPFGEDGLLVTGKVSPCGLVAMVTKRKNTKK